MCVNSASAISVSFDSANVAVDRRDTLREPPATASGIAEGNLFLYAGSANPVEANENAIRCVTF
jgi:hypothetical protein